MIQSAAIVILLLVCGDAVSERFALPVPGAALGLAALSLAFAMRGGPNSGSEALFDLAAPYFPLFFVPAAVGVVAKVDMLAGAWAFIAAAVFLGTAATLVATGLVFQTLLQRGGSTAPA